MCFSDKKPSDIVTWLPKFSQAFQCGGCESASCSPRGNRDRSLTTFGQPIRESLLRVYSASGSTIPKIEFSINGLILYADGYRVDTIKGMLPRKDSRCRSCNRKTKADRWTRVVRKMKLETCGVGKVPEAYLRSVVGDRAMRGRPRSLEKMPDAWLSILEEAACFHDTCGCDVDEQAKDIITTMYEFSERNRNRRVFAITERSLGFVARESKEGDTICILLGCSVPVVLRDIGDSAFEFVGECYIHGLMEGEFMHLASENAWKPERIEIH